MITSRPLPPLVLSLLLAACSGGRSGETLPEELPAPPTPPRTAAAAPEALYDETGALLPSNEVLAGLPLPRGLETALREERRTVFRSQVPVSKLLAYFGPRLVTGQVDSLPGGGARYVQAVPRDARGGVVHLDVSVEPSSAAVSRVEIVEHEPAPLSPPPQEESLRRLRERMERAD